MKHLNKIWILLPMVFVAFLAGCEKDDDDNFDTSGTYTQRDQMARPGIATVFVSTARKDEFNTTIPTNMNAAFKTEFVAKLTSFGYTTNALGLNKDAFANVLVTDVLNVNMNGATTFGSLSGRMLSDDVIDTELTLIFGGASGTSNPGLIKDNVNANDKAFLSTFPYLAAPF